MSVSVLSNFTPHFNANVRTRELLSKIQDFGQKMKIPARVRLALGQFHSSPSAALGSYTIKIPTWFLFKYEDIPLRFRITDIDDPRLTDQNYLNDLAGWMNERFREAGLSSVIREADYKTLQTVIKLVRDQNLYEKSKDFVLNHELSHLTNSQIRGRHLSQMKEAIPIAGIIGGILLLFFAVSIIPFVHLAVTLAVAGISVTITLVGGLIYWVKAHSTQEIIEEEKSADMDASRILQDATGGIYLFETFRHQNLATRRSDPTVKIDANGNNLRDKEHPPLTERIAYLKAWQAQHVRA